MFNPSQTTDQVKADLVATFKSTAALAAIALLSISAGAAEVADQQTKALLLMLWAAPAAFYLLYRSVYGPKPVTLEFVTLERFKETNPTGSNPPALPAAEFGCSPRSAIAADGVDAAPNETTQLANTSASTNHPSRNDADLPLGAHFPNERPETKPNVLTTARQTASMVAPLFALMVRNPSTAAGTILLGVLAAMGVLA